MITELYVSPTRIGTVALASGSVTITGTNTQFTSSLVGKKISFRTDDGNINRTVTTYTSATSITVNTSLDITQSGVYYYTTYESVDLLADIPFSLNYSIADIREPDKRNATFSKTITIPGSKNNNQIFDHIFEIDGSGGYNPNIKAEAILYVDTVEIFKGILQLNKINKTDNDITYECNLLGRIGDIFSKLGDSKLTDLDYSAYNHTLSMANQVTSWSAAIGTGYVYPLIDYGFQTDGKTFQVQELFPAIYLKDYIDKIFSFAGYSYSSSFFTSDFFKRLIIPFNSDSFKISDAQVQARQFSAGSTNDTTVNICPVSGFQVGSDIAINDDSSGDFYDPSNVFNTSTYTWTVPSNGRYKVMASAPVKLFYDIFDTDVVTAQQMARITVYLEIYKVSTGATIAAASVVYPQATVTPQNFSAEKTVTIVIPDKKLFTGEQYRTRVSVRTDRNLSDTFELPDFTYTEGNIIVYASAGSTFFNQISDSNYIEGDSLDMNSALPKNTLQKDLLTSIIKMFNLYIETDKDLDSKLIIEPRNDFYSTSTNRDWTNKLDISQPLQISPMGDLNARKYKYTYKEDKDYYNDKYLKLNDEVYGERLIEIENDFVSETIETSPIFSATPAVGSTTSNRVTPAIFAVDQKGVIAPKASNLRILYYGGLKTSTPAWMHRSTLTSSTSDTERNTYPYAGHFDDPYSPTIDLNFGQTRELYYVATNVTLTNNNIYNKYHKQFLEEITDKDSKIISGMFYLTPLDMALLDFRDNFFVDGHYLRLNKIEDYDPINLGLTKCEFIKIKQGVAFVSTTQRIYGGSDGLIGSEKTPKFNLTKQSNDNTYTNGTQQVNGSGNYVDPNATNISINGNTNSVFNSTNILINGSNNTVNSGLTNVTIIGSNTTATASNQTWINGVLQVSNNGGYNLIQGGRDEVRNIGATSQYNLIQGGRDEVRNIGATSPTHIINGGKNSI